MIVLGLTGSIGMGKSTTAKMFADAGVPVHDSDAAVHRLYAGEAVPQIEAAFPGTTNEKGVDRQALARRVLDDRSALARLEAIIHPLVRADADRFLAAQRAAGADIAVLDIPLLFETGGEDRVDRIVVVTAPPEIQAERVLSRPGMTRDKFEAILAHQVPDADKRRRADFVIDTSLGMEAARAEVARIIATLRAEGAGEDDPGTTPHRH